MILANVLHRIQLTTNANGMAHYVPPKNQKYPYTSIYCFLSNTGSSEEELDNLNDSDYVQADDEDEYEYDEENRNGDEENGNIPIRPINLELKQRFPVLFDTLPDSSRELKYLLLGEVESDTQFGTFRNVKNAAKRIKKMKKRE